MRNTWYVAAWSEEIEPGQRLARTLLGRPTLLLRGSDGGVSVLDDRCPHRFAPLSLGRFDGQTITCGYHGMDFDAAGVWTRNPHDATLIPDSDD